MMDDGYGDEGGPGYYDGMGNYVSDKKDKFTNA